VKLNPQICLATHNYLMMVIAIVTNTSIESKFSVNYSINLFKSSTNIFVISFCFRKSDKIGGLPEKQFLARNSLLTDLFRIKHIRTIYHIFIAMLIILFLNTVIYDLVDTGT
jgi:hypothetical protein